MRFDLRRFPGAWHSAWRQLALPDNLTQSRPYTHTAMHLQQYSLSRRNRQSCNGCLVFISEQIGARDGNGMSVASVASVQLLRSLADHEVYDPNSRYVGAGDYVLAGTPSIVLLRIVRIISGLQAGSQTRGARKQACPGTGDVHHCVQSQLRREFTRL